MASDEKPATQKNRPAILATPLAMDVLLFSRMDCIEGMGELFEYRIEALSEIKNGKLDFGQVLGRNCSVHLNTSDNVGRDFSGVLTEAIWVGHDQRFNTYRLVLRPWLWLLCLTSDCRIFSNMTPIQIIKQVFTDRKFSESDYDYTNVKGQYPTLEYTVQYQETDLNFVLRLMEEYGIYYYFQFAQASGDGSASAHKLMLADSQVYADPLKPLSIQYLPGASGPDKQQCFNSWTKISEVVTGVFTLNDYDYQGPGKNLLATANHNYSPIQHGDMEIYKFIGDYDKQNNGQQLANVLRDAERTHNLRVSAFGYAPSLTPGYKITRTTPTNSNSSQGNGSGASQKNDGEDGEYGVLRCAHSYGYQTYVSGSGGGGSYVGNFQLATKDTPFRMPARARKPFIAGTQSALVVGKQGEEIDVDEQGRICVQFYWDRKKSGSRRIRVAQFWAGMQRGTLYLPRIGDEVLVAYDEGDPDRPLVVGSVYNGNNKVPTPLPAKKTHSGILTRSSKGGNGYHMLLFEDLAGSEFVKLRSQKDLMFKALNNEQRDIVSSQTENVGQDETINVGFPVPPQGTGPGSGNFTLNALNKVTINVGPQGSPLTQLIMDTSSITLNVGPGGSMSQIVMNQTSISVTSTQITVTGNATVSISAPMVDINS